MKIFIKWGAVPALVIVVSIATVLVARAVERIWFAPPEKIYACSDRAGTYHSDRPTEVESYYKCVDTQARLFLDKDFAEAKDLGKAFLTLLTALLVASIAFSEKIVDVNRAGRWALGMMITCWLLLLGAIVACGAGLALMSTAAGLAAYTPEFEYHQLEVNGVTLFVLAGVSFAVGLASLLIAGVISIIQRRADSLRDQTG